ncbi:MAG: M48 family metallopeptidase [Candidatus Micrarchaeota archaeon]
MEARIESRHEEEREMEKTIEVNGKQYAVRRVGTHARRARASVRCGTIFIKVPVSWPREEQFRAAAELEEKIVAGLRNAPDRFERRGLDFFDGQVARVWGREFRVSVRDGRGEKSSSAGFSGGVVEVVLAQGIGESVRQKHVSNLARRVISSVLLPQVDKRVRELNDKHFGFAPRKVFIKDNLSNWGSCSQDGNINLSFRLLLAPPEHLDYVIMHELAHLKEKGHSPAFWSLVEKAVPDYRDRRRWLNKNGANLVIAPLAQDLAGNAMGEQNGADEGLKQCGKDAGIPGGPTV